MVSVSSIEIGKLISMIKSSWIFDSFMNIVLFCMYFESNCAIKSLVSPKIEGFTLSVEDIFDNECTSLITFGWLKVFDWSHVLVDDKVDLINTLRVSSVSFLGLNHSTQYPIRVTVYAKQYPLNLLFELIVDKLCKESS